MGILYVPFAVIVIVGTSNAVNLTDGLDGLAIVPVMIVAGCFALIAYLAGNYNFATIANQLRPRHRRSSRNVRCINWRRFRILWFNAPPARVFMGDTGSLALGGGLAPFRLQHAMNWCWQLLAGYSLSRPFLSFCKSPHLS